MRDTGAIDVEYRPYLMRAFKMGYPLWMAQFIDVSLAGWGLGRNNLVAPNAPVFGSIPVDTGPRTLSPSAPNRFRQSANA